eukprot:5323054-Pyramimonas_sp.AAC.1
MYWSEQKEASRREAMDLGSIPCAESCAQAGNKKDLRGHCGPRATAREMRSTAAEDSERIGMH